jgi:hypothetical protein
MGRKKEKIFKMQERCDRRSAEFVVRNLDVIEEQINDLVAEMQVFRRYGDLASLAYVLGTVKALRRKYEKFADGLKWEEDDDEF